MNQATVIYPREFDAICLGLPVRIRERIEARLRNMGQRLERFPHQRLQGWPEFRLRVGDYRIVYTFNVPRNELCLVTLGHRRDVYR